MNEKRFKVVGLGEVLWDCLPTGKQLGGAPANFAYVSDQLGNHGIIASRIGSEPEEEGILERLSRIKVDVSHLQQDLKHPTGTVKVLFQNGQPTYEITENVAWDFLEMNDDWRNLAETCDAVCFGTLAQRNPVSRQTIQAFVDLTRGLRIFDVNLRQHYFSIEVLRKSFELANIVKLNHEELPQIVAIFGIKGVNKIEQAQNLREKFDLRLVCVTRGGEGSFLITKNENSDHRGVKVKIGDTIGAGDSFTATLTHGLLHGWDLSKINQKANQVGAFVASKIGGMPNFSKEIKL